MPRDAKDKGRRPLRTQSDARRKAALPIANETRPLGVAPEDDFGPKLIARAGRVPRDIDLEF